MDSAALSSSGATMAPMPSPVATVSMALSSSPYHSTTGSPAVSSVVKTHNINVPEAIKQIQQKIAAIGPGPHTPAQKQEFNKLNNTLVKLHAANQQIQAGMKPDLSSGLLQLPTSVTSRSSVSHSATADGKVLDKRRLGELVKEVDPLEQLDDDVEEMLMQIADDFIDNVVNSSCLVAKHRKANTVDVKDVQLHLERNWNMWIPGFGSDDLRPYKKQATTEAHKQRLALIKKTMKKY